MRGRPPSPNCLDCGVIKTAENTYRSGKYLNSWCKKCKIKRTLKWKAEHPENVKANSRRFFMNHREELYQYYAERRKKHAKPRVYKLNCPSCGVLKTPDNTGKCKNRKFELADYCRSCNNMKARKWVSEHRESVNESARNYRLKYPDRFAASQLRYWKKKMKECHASL